MLATSSQPSSSSTSTPTSPNFNAAFSHRPSVSDSSSRPGTPIDAMLEPPAGISFISYLKGWHDAQVGRWLQEYKCGAQASVFASNDIRGDVLLELDNVTLKEMGIISVGDRVRILSGVKALRLRCSRGRQSSAPASDNTSLQPPDSDVADISPTQKLNRRLETSRPPPLHLAYNAHSGLPKVDRQNQSSSSTPESAKTTVTTPRPTPQATSSVSSATSNRHQHLPPLPPPPRSQPPMPPAGTPNNSRNVRPLAIPNQPHLSGRRTPTQPDVSTPVSGAWNGDYGLPPRPNAGKTSNTTAPRATSPLPQTPLSVPKRNGGGLLPASTIISPPRQSHERAYSLPGNNPRQTTLNSHPYAPSPSGQVLQPPSNVINQLSPIAESFITQTPVSSHPPASLASGSGSDYRNGRGLLSSLPGRPNTPGSRSIDDIRRKTIKFHLPEEGTSRTFDLAEYEDGVKVLEKVLKKFGKLSSGNQSDVEADSLEAENMSGSLIVDGWGVFLSTGNGDAQVSPLSEAELLAVCHSELDHPVREHGLTLRRVYGSKQKRSKPLISIFGEEPPTQTQRGSPTSPTSGNSGGDQEALLKPGESRARRASMVSVINGLNMNEPESPYVDATSPDKPAKRSRLRNFLGQRPPSEVITTHLQDFFPFTEKKVLQRTARHSMMRQRRESNRDSFMSAVGKASWNKKRESQPPSSRFSTSSMGSAPRTSLSEKRYSVSSPALSGVTSEGQDSPIAAPRVSLSTEDGQSRDLNLEDEKFSDSASVASSARSTKHLLPPVVIDSEGFSEILPSMSQRYSQLRELRSKRDTSDTASILTVDEITAEVDSRRTSIMVKTEEALEDAIRKRDSVAPPLSADSDQSVPQEEVLLQHEDDEVSDEDDDTELVEGVDEEDEDLDIIADGEEDEDAPSKAITSSGARTIKWIQGALIGRGSFGSVFLAMDSQRGLLMAVKQVELPTGSSQNVERKKGMLTALEREIELLKDLQHDNIVQYLDSSMDNEHLNIFLEYVPGGSVTALLRNYGAFEEPLVKNFVRQILQGLSYLHSRDIIHRDIKGANILVDNKSCVKISDFGISKRVEDNLLSHSKAHRPSLQGSVFWMAPEVVKQTSYTHKADIWSLGCLCVEMFTGEHPWAQLTQMQAIFKIGSSAKPTIPSDISSEADDFMQKTFNLDYQARPGASELLEHPWITSDPTIAFEAAKRSANAGLNAPKLTVTSSN